MRKAKVERHIGHPDVQEWGLHEQPHEEMIAGLLLLSMRLQIRYACMLNAQCRGGGDGVNGVLEYGVGCEMGEASVLSMKDASEELKWRKNEECLSQLVLPAVLRLLPLIRFDEEERGLGALGRIAQVELVCEERSELHKQVGGGQEEHLLWQPC